MHKVVAGIKIYQVIFRCNKYNLKLAFGLYFYN